MTTSNEHNNAPAVPQGEPVAWMVYGNYTRQPFGMLSSAEAYMRGLLKSDPDGGYHIRPLRYATPAPAPAPAQEPAPTWSLREALQKAKDALSLALSDVDWRKDSPTQPVIHKAYNCAHQALALPTAEVMTNGLTQAETDASAPVSGPTAPLASERELFEQWWKGDLVDWRGHEAVPALHAWAAWQARAAMSAGYAVDAQRYRWLADCNNYEAGLALIIDPKLTEQALDAAIDAAMRKDKP